MHATAVSLLGLEGSLDGVPPGGVRSRTAVVYRRTRRSIVIAQLLLYPRLKCLAVSTGLCYTPRPEADGVRVPARSRYKLKQSPSFVLITQDAIKVITPLPDFGIDRMADLRRLYSVSLWKSGPFFSTATKEAELMVIELRLNLRSTAARFARGRGSDQAGNREGGVGPRLSTAFAEQNSPASPGPYVLIRSPKGASRQGETM